MLPAITANRRFPAYILLSGAVPGPTGAALLFSWLGWERPGVTAGPLFFGPHPRVRPCIVLDGPPANPLASRRMSPEVNYG